MRLNTLTFYKSTETDRDRLGNPILELISIGNAKGRLSNWTSEEIALEGREFTRTNEKLITTASMDMCKQSDAVEMNGIKYEIKERTDVGRWRLLTVQAFRM